MLTKAPEPGIPEVSADTRVYYQPPAPLGVKFGAEQETLQNPLHSDETSNHSNRGMRMAQCLQCEKTDQQVPLLKMQFQDAEVHICPQCLPVLIHKPANLADRLPGMQPGQPPQHEHQ
ncbi:MAG: hypothetical protein JXB85_10535 [Anaerolineales bacterium]|nr:hypothetical protein [Anaerolineales bacterium]